MERTSNEVQGTDVGAIRTTINLDNKPTEIVEAVDAILINLQRLKNVVASTIEVN